jgi:deoxyribose-phosphate aldolase
MISQALQDKIQQIKLELTEIFGPLPIVQGTFQPIPAEELASTIDHTLLKPEATRDAIETLCKEAIEYNFKSVCINPVFVNFAASLLQGKGPLVCTVIGFPLGANTTKVKVFEAKQAVEEGAKEVDMVIPIGLLKEKDYRAVFQDIHSVVTAVKDHAKIKVIIETSLLTSEEKIAACLLSQLAGADFVKTSTGFSTGGATLDDSALMRETVGPSMGVKASGGVRTREAALQMLQAGATRIGASAGITIVTGQTSSTSGY